MTLKNIYLPQSISETDWGTFIAPEEKFHSYDNPYEIADIPIFSGYKAEFAPLRFRNALFDSVTEKIISQRNTITFEDQCSAKYYFDIFNVSQEVLPKINRIAEVGVYTGGASCIIAGCIEDTDTELDLIDVNKNFLRYSYERIRRLFPKAAARTRLFFGDLPTYVKKVMLDEQQRRYLIHHDASHTFNVVVRDLAALSFVKDSIYGLMIQDTHLRGGNINSFLFVDAALFAVFGDNMRYIELGVKFPQVTDPAFHYNEEGTYFNSNQAEGMFIPFAQIQFRYPHPSIKMECFFDE